MSTYSQTLTPGAVWYRATMTAVASDGTRYPNDSEGDLAHVLSRVRDNNERGGILGQLEKLTRRGDGRLDHESLPLCPSCAEIGKGFGPSHDGSQFCESGSLASGGNRAHCTCDACF